MVQPLGKGITKNQPVTLTLAWDESILYKLSSIMLEFRCKDLMLAPVSDFSLGWVWGIF